MKWIILILLTASCCQGAVDITDVAMPPRMSSLRKGLISYWTLDNTSWLDALGTNSLTALGSPTTVSGIISNAATFASGKYLIHTNNASLALSNSDMTLSAWVLLTTKGANKYPVSKTDAVTADEYFFIFANATNRYQFRPNASDTVTANNFGSPQTNTWTHLLGTFNNTTKVASFQVNAGTANTITGTVFRVGGSGLFSIGSYHTNSTFSWPGSVDEVALWNRVLSSNEVNNLYHSGYGVTWRSFVSSITNQNLSPPIVQRLLEDGSTLRYLEDGSTVRLTEPSL